MEDSFYKILDKNGVEIPDHWSGRRRTYDEAKKMVDGLNKNGEHRPYTMIEINGNMAQLKLYTKEMFLIAAEKCEVSMIDAEHIMKYIDEYVTPIELPSDEEIEKEKYSHFPDVDSVDMGTERFAFKMGAKWMRDKILNK